MRTPRACCWVARPQTRPWCTRALRAPASLVGYWARTRLATFWPPGWPITAWKYWASAPAARQCTRLRWAWTLGGRPTGTPGRRWTPELLLAAWAPGHVYLSGINLCFQRPLTDAACAFGRTARAVGGRAVLDIGQGGPGALDFAEITAIAAEMDLLIGSRAEFAVALGCPYTEGRARLRERFAGPVVVKQGAQGALLDPGHGQALRQVPGFEVAAINPIGAGDAFAGGLLSAWLAGADLAGGLPAGQRRRSRLGKITGRPAGCHQSSRGSARAGRLGTLWRWPWNSRPTTPCRNWPKPSAATDSPTCRGC